MQLDEDTTAGAINRLRRAEGQIAGVIRMLESGASRRLSAALQAVADA